MAHKPLRDMLVSAADTDDGRACRGGRGRPPCSYPPVRSWAICPANAAGRKGMAPVKNVFQTGRRTSIDTGADMKATLLTMAGLASALLAACGGGTQAPPGSPPVAEKPSATAPAAEAPPSAPAASVKHIQLEEVDPAEVVILSLQDLDLPADADSVTPSGAISNALLMDGTLRFSTPGDTGEDQEATLEIKSGAATTIGHVLIRSH